MTMRRCWLVGGCRSCTRVTTSASNWCVNWILRIYTRKTVSSATSWETRKLAYNGHTYSSSFDGMWVDEAGAAAGTNTNGEVPLKAHLDSIG